MTIFFQPQYSRGVHIITTQDSHRLKKLRYYFVEEGPHENSNQTVGKFEETVQLNVKAV